MSLRSKIVLVLCAVVAAYAAVDNAISRGMVSEGFRQLEQEEAEKDLDRVVGALEVEEAHLAELSASKALAGPLYARFARGETPRLDDVGAADFEPEALDVCMILDAEGHVLAGRVEDPETREPIHLRAIPSERLDPDYHPLLSVPSYVKVSKSGEHADPVAERRNAGWISGILETARGPLIAAASPILGPDGAGPRVGTLICGRFLSRSRLDSIGARVRVTVDAWSLLEDIPVEQEMLDSVTAAGEPVTRLVSDEELEVFTTLPDVEMRPDLILRATVARSVTARGYEVVRYAMLTAIGSALFILTALLFLLQRLVLRPLGDLTEHAVEIGRTDDTTRRIGIDRADEIGQLASEFDGMIEKLAVSRAAHAETARQVGMSEIATGVLHNVGNVLNSVNVSTSLVNRKVAELRVGDLDKMLGVLKQNADDLPTFIASKRGQHMLPFLDELSQALAAEREGIQEELRGLGEGIEHIAELVRSQQSYAGLSGLYETASMTEVLDSALKITQQALGGAEDVEITREYDELPGFQIDKRKVTEILVNLIQNARHAMAEAGVASKRLSLRVQRSGGETVRVSVTDNGVGIGEENLARIFNHGFTTKPEGHGFGLHSAANAATEMKGRLFAESAGAGHGATFVLELPTDPRSASVPTAAAA